MENFTINILKTISFFFFILHNIQNSHAHVSESNHCVTFKTDNRCGAECSDCPVVVNVTYTNGKSNEFKWDADKPAGSSKTMCQPLNLDNENVLVESVTIQQLSNTDGWGAEKLLIEDPPASSEFYFYSLAPPGYKFCTDGDDEGCVQDDFACCKNRNKCQLKTEADGERFWVEDGCVEDGETSKGSFKAKSYQAGVRCCTNDGKNCVTEFNCEDGLTSYSYAVSQCAKLDHRLCNKDELLTGVCCGTGGGCDNYEVWTSTAAPATTTKKPTTTVKKTTKAPPTTTPKKTTTGPLTTTTKKTTTYSPTTTTEAPYDCLDIMVDDCRDETLDVIETFPAIDSLEDCQTLCNFVYKDICNSFIYYISTKTCTVLRDNFSPYLYDCGSFGGGSDTISNCLEDDSTYPNECKNMIESECIFQGKVMAEVDEVLEPEECLMASEVFHGKYYVHEVTTRKCTVYDSNKRVCNVQRGISGLSNCPA